MTPRIDIKTEVINKESGGRTNSWGGPNLLPAGLTNLDLMFAKQINWSESKLFVYGRNGPSIRGLHVEPFTQCAQL